MASPAQALQTLTNDFTSSVALVDTVRQLRYPASSGRRFTALPHFQTALIAELAFLRCFLSWEVFLEDIFVAYVQGSRSPGGASYQSYISSPNLKHTRDLIR